MTDTVLDRSVAEVVARLKDKGLISLYLCGSFGTQDELPSSDVDLLSVVKDDLDSREAALSPGLQTIPIYPGVVVGIV